MSYPLIRLANQIQLLAALSALILLILLLVPITALAQMPEVEVQVIPDKIELRAKGQGEVLIVVRNPFTTALNNVKLSSFTDAGVEISIETEDTREIKPNGTMAWRGQLSQRQNEPVAGTVHFRLDYTWPGNDKIKNVSQVALGSLAVAARQPETAEQVAEVRLEAAQAAIMERRPGLIYLIVTNTTDVPIQVTHISQSGPAFVTFGPPDLGNGVSLGARQVRAFPIKVEATGAVQPGKHLLLFEVALAWEKTGRAWTGSLAATHEVEIGVLGESEILTAIGVPSFLILPGFLMVMTWGLLWRLLPAKATDFPLKAATPEFWFVAITLSLLTAIVYPFATIILGAPRNYLDGYTLGDIISIWFASIILAGVIYLLGAGGYNLWRHLRLWQERRRIPSSKDTPITVLKKLHQQNLGLELKRVEFTMQGENQRAFLLENHDESQTRLWIGPAIIVEWLEGASPALQQKVEQQLNPKGSAARLAELLQEGQKLGALRVRWKPMGRITGPYEANNTDILKFLDPGFLIEQE